MRFFDTNELFYKFENTLDVSTGTAQFAFDEKPKTKWVTDGEDSDTNPVYIENIPPSSIIINRIFITETNISDLAVFVDVGAGYVSLSYTKLTKSEDEKNWFFEFDEITTSKIKITGQTTIVADEEKEIRQIYAFNELGRLEFFDNISPNRNRIQAINKLKAGKVHIITQGSHFTFKLRLKAHYKEVDNEIIDIILRRDNPFFIWINDNTENVMVMKQEPYRFSDIYKIGVIKKNSISFTKNLFFSGIDSQINFEEVY